MGRPPGGARALGPYRDRRGWRVVLVEGDGTRSSHTFASEGEAARFRRDASDELETTSRTIGAALDEYEQHLADKGNKARSRKETMRRMRAFFPVDDELHALTAKRCRALYEAAQLDADGDPRSADTHRNYLAEAKTFLRYCVRRKWLAVSHLESVEGVGRRSRGKPQLTVDEARALLAECLRGARRGEPGAVAVALALLLGLRSSEITERVVRDLDDDGRLLRVPASKTDAGRRVVEVPSVLRPHLLRLTRGRPAAEPLLGAHHWRDYVSEHARRLCVAAGVSVVSAHGLRGTHATLAVAAGATSHLVAGQLGHTSSAMTEAAYARPEAVARGVATRTGTVLVAHAGGRARRK